MVEISIDEDDTIVSYTISTKFISRFFQFLFLYPIILIGVTALFSQFIPNIVDLVFETLQPLGLALNILIQLPIVAGLAYLSLSEKIYTLDTAEGLITTPEGEKHILRADSRIDFRVKYREHLSSTSDSSGSSRGSSNSASSVSKGIDVEIQADRQLIHEGEYGLSQYPKLRKFADDLADRMDIKCIHDVATQVLDRYPDEEEVEDEDDSEYLFR